MRYAIHMAALLAPWFVSSANAAATTEIAGRTYALAAKCPNASYDVSLTVCSTQAKPGAALDVVLAASGAKDYYRLVVDEQGTEFSASHAGRVRGLARVGTGLGQLARTGTIDLLVKRRERTLRILANGRLLIRSFDTAHAQGAAGVALGAWSVKAAHYQKQGDVELHDSFMRDKEHQELAPWDRHSGQWRFHSVREKHEQARAANASNPFCLAGKADAGGPAAVVTVGQAFWDDYAAGVSLRISAGAAGLVYNYRGPQDHWLVRLAASMPGRSPCQLELMRVQAGKRSVVAKTHVAALAGQWYRLGVATQGCRATVTFDDWPVFDVVDPCAAGGKVGLYAEGQNEAVFDDVDVVPTHWLRFDHEAALATGAAAPAKTWQWGPSAEAGRALSATYLTDKLSAGPVPVVGHVLRPTAALAKFSFGGERWQKYVLKATLTHAPQAHWLGLGAGGGLLFRVGRADAKGEWQAQWVDASKPDAPRVLAQSRMPAPESKAIEVELDLTHDGLGKAYIDGYQVLRVPRQVEPGQPWLYAQGAQGSAFANVAVGRRLDRDWETQPSNEVFVNDPFMANWATQRGAWVPEQGAQNAYWHCGDCYGTVQVTMPLQHGVSLTLSCEDGPAGAGYEVTAALGSTPKANDTAPFLIRLKRGGKETGHAAVVPGEDATLAFERDGHYVTAHHAGKEVLCYRDPSPLSATRLGLRAPGEIDLGRVTVRRDHVMDYVFETAPWEWSQTGLWEVTNRFACYPIWAHLNGRSLAAIILWSKFDYQGDVTVEFYAGLRMRQDTDMWREQPGSYPRQGDLNAALMADGRRLDSGYNFIACAWDSYWSERWTRILRGQATVAQTDQHVLPRTRKGPHDRPFAVAWMPRQGERPVHGAWYYLKARKHGSELSYWCDGHRILAHHDPEPLRAGRVALWSQNNSIVLARAKISYRCRRVLCPIAAEPRPHVASVPAAVAVRSSTHPGTAADFEAGTCGWETAGLDQGALVEVDRSTAATGQASLRLTNVNTGGDFGVRVPVPELDALHVAALRFHYKITPDVRVNIYFRLNGDLHFIEFTGETYSNENVKKVGSIAGVKADGQWHGASFDLGRALRRLYPLGASLPLTDLRIGHWHEGYLSAGIGGNGAGTSWNIDDFVLATVAPTPIAVSWDGGGSYGVTLDPHGHKPGAPQPLQGKQASFSPKSPGLYRVRIWAQQGGQWLQVGSHAAVAQPEPLSVASVAPASGAKWHGEPVRIAFRPAGGCHPSPVLILTFNGARLPVNWKTTDYDPAAQTVTFDVASSPLCFADGQRIDCLLQFAESAASCPRRSSFEWHYVMDRAGDKLPPSDVTVSGYLAHSTFETGLDLWQARSGAGYARLLVDNSTAAVGKRSLKVFNRIVGGSLGVLVHQDAFNAGAHPLMMFRYKLDSDVHTDFLVNTAPLGWARQIRFTDYNDYYGLVGSVSSAVADSKWHAAEVNLRASLASQAYHPRMFHVSCVHMADCGSLENGPTQSYHIDDFRIVPVLSATRGFKLAVSATDLSGIKGFSWHWSASPSEDADTQIDGVDKAVLCKAAPQGKAHLHIRAQDNAGNWGVTTHWPFMIDNTPPTARPTGLWAENIAGASDLTLAISDAGPAGVDPETLGVKVNGESSSFDPFFTRFDLASGALSWEWALATGLFSGPVANGTTITIQVPPLADFAGNQAGALKIVAKVAFDRDKEPPLPPEVVCLSQRTVCFDTFTKSLGQWANWGGRWCGIPARALDKGRGHHCVRVVNQHYNSTFGVYARTGAFDLDATPWVSFDYNLPKSVKVHFMAYVGKTWHAIALTSETKGSDYKTVGSVPNVVADGQWHSTCFNLREVLATGIEGGLPSKEVTHLTIAAYQSLYNAAGATYSIDNFAIFGTGSHKPVFDVSAVDPSGIKAYAFAMDQKQDTVPAKDRVVSSGRIAPSPLAAAGQYYLHVCAQDGAGNWSQATHFPYRVASVPASPKPKPTTEAPKIPKPPAEAAK